LHCTVIYVSVMHPVVRITFQEFYRMTINILITFIYVKH
jgi:hypothetical protein